MGEAKRRKEQGEVNPTATPWWNREKSKQFVEITTKGAWVGIGLTVAYWLVVRFIGPALGGWQLQD